MIIEDLMESLSNKIVIEIAFPKMKYFFGGPRVVWVVKRDSLSPLTGEINTCTSIRQQQPHARPANSRLFQVRS